MIDIWLAPKWMNTPAGFVSLVSRNSTPVRAAQGLIGLNIDLQGGIDGVYRSRIVAKWRSSRKPHLKEENCTNGK